MTYAELLEKSKGIVVESWAGDSALSSDISDVVERHGEPSVVHLPENFDFETAWNGYEFAFDYPNKIVMFGYDGEYSRSVVFLKA